MRSIRANGFLGGLCAALLSFVPGPAHAEGIGRVKVASGDVTIERGTERIPAVVGMTILQSDRIVTGRDGSIGVTLADNAMLSAGPSSVLALERFSFDPSTREGNLDVSLESGTLSGIAGKMVTENPGAMKVRTPAAVLGVRGTEFAVRVEESGFRRAWRKLAGGPSARHAPSPGADGPEPRAVGPGRP